MKRTTVEMGSFGPQVASARAASAAVSAWAKPDQARVLSVLQSFGPAAGPHLAGGLAKHFEQRNVAGRRLAERYDHNGDKVAAARDRFSAAEEANASAAPARCECGLGCGGSGQAARAAGVHDPATE